MALLQIPGSGELLVLFGFLISVVGLVVLVGATYWVYTDATNRGDDNAVLWAAGTAAGFFFGLLPGVLVVVIYVLTRE